MSTTEKWYSDGLKFKCTQCGNCCTGSPGVVWVTDEELQAIADFRGESIGETRITHTKLLGGRRTLRDYPNGDCTFFDGQTRRCTIYPVRPPQCGTWPFWNSNLESQDTWKRGQTVCPGMGNGDLVQLEEIERQAAIIDI
ncbi:YkgJ family cysteine cluster protein [Schlesneria sp. T3-172]|uniref:YkgJ family cysteine cluster protein n=1 Tax=Schlesneria sphaerica TaxID=3373610 RepID=UPI0037C7E6AE